MEALGLENILSGQEIDSLFGDSEDPVVEEAATEPSQEDEGKSKSIDTNKTTEVVNPDDLFEDEETKQPEGVGSEKNNEEKGDASTDKDGTSPDNFYSSIANALAVDGIFPNLDEEAINKATDAESFSNLIEAEVQARFDDGQRRILEALKNGVEPDQIRQYEVVLQRISSITDAQVSEEGEKGERLRFDLIYQDYLNKGYSQQRAQKLTERSIDAGTDIEDAKEALQSNKEFFLGKYNELQENARVEAEKVKAEREKQEAKLRKSILEDKDLMGDMELSKDIRKKVYDNISRPVYKDPETGQYMTALQKYEMEHHEDFIKYVGLFMTITNGFKDFKSFAKGEVKKEMKKGLRDLQEKLSNTKRNSDGSYNLVGSNRKSDPESFLEGGFKLAL